MLFSDPAVASFVRAHFAAAWEGVRPVPVVEIDFGNGTKLKRTVNGNIATYVCTPDGRVVDVVPGLNSPQAYLEDLRRALNLYRAAQGKFDATVLDYHKENLTTPTVYEWVRNDMAKALVERLVRMSLDKKQELTDRQAMGVRVVPGPTRTPTSAALRKLSEEDAALLAADTDLNRRERKPIVHRILAEKIWTPADLTKRIYKDVLHCDLDDPYLGLISKAFNGGAYENR